MRKWIAAIIATGTLGGGIFLLGGEEKDKPVSTKISDSIGTKSVKYSAANPNVQAAIDQVIALYDRREKGVEPTKEEWESVEIAVDAMRVISDSEELRKVDRMLEVHDANQKYIDEEFTKP